MDKTLLDMWVPRGQPTSQVFFGAFSSARQPGGDQWSRLKPTSMFGENRQLVTKELVEFEK